MTKTEPKAFLQIRARGERVCAMLVVDGPGLTSALHRRCDGVCPGAGSRVTARREPISLVNCPKCLEKLGKLVPGD